MSQVSDTVPLLRRMAEERAGRAAALLRRRTAEAAVSTGQRPGRLDGGYASTVAAQRSPIEVLLDDEGLDDRVTRLLDGELDRDHTRRPGDRADGRRPRHAALLRPSRGADRVPGQPDPRRHDAAAGRTDP